MAPPRDRTATLAEWASWEFDIDDATGHEDLRGSGYTEGRDKPLFDSLTIARQLTEAGIDRAHADALADAIRQAAEHGERVTPDMLDSRIATAETRLTWRMIAVGGLVVAALRLLG